LVDRSLVSSSRTQQEAYSKATTFLSQAKDAASFDEEAEKAGYAKLVAENVMATQSTIPGLDNPRQMIRWVYGADKGDVSDQVFEMGNKFTVAKVVDIYKEGVLALDQVKDQIEPLVRNKVKARIQLEKMTKALEGATSIEQVAQKA